MGVWTLRAVAIRTDGQDGQFGLDHFSLPPVGNSVQDRFGIYGFDWQTRAVQVVVADN
jgi:hypothetical protein